jgi:hypothetical protein
MLLWLLWLLLCGLQAVYACHRTRAITIYKIGHAALTITEAKVQLTGAA